VPVVDAGAPAVAATGDGRLELETTPALELQIDGKSLGRTPFRGALSPGRKVLVLINKELGIRTTRVVTISPGETQTVNVSLSQGYVTLSAPEGASVFIDERRIGNAPIRGEIPVYEGAHKIIVHVGKARWNENFTIAGGQRVNFNVEQQ
ncbi:MAG: PEGA domain-containing protein, partial [Myxococcaceae bacterium]|nr:PEGA domain-containing protein [Myxococcaceae bacterium]